MSLINRLKSKKLLACVLIIFSMVISQNIILIRMNQTTPSSSTTINIFQSDSVPQADFSFTQNIGQIKNPNLLFYFESPSLFISFFRDRISYSLLPNGSSIVENFNVTFLNSNYVTPIGLGVNTALTNIFHGNSIIQGIKSYSTIMYKNFYTNIDLKFYFSSSGLKYEFLSNSGDINQIKMSFSNNVGLQVTNSEINLRLPGLTLNFDSGLKVFDSNSNTIISANFIEYDQTTYGFNINKSDYINKNIIIDPILFSKVIKSSYVDEGKEIKVDQNGNIYLAGETYSTDFPVLNAYNSTFGGISDVFVQKYDKNWNLIYSTYVGGNDSEYVNALAYDSAGNCYVTGSTNSIDFPSTAKIQVNNSLNNTVIFVFKLDSTGKNLLFSTLIGGEGIDTNSNILLDKNNDIIIAGFTNSQQFPYDNNSSSLDVFRQYKNISNDFIAKIAPNGSTMLSCSLLPRSDRFYSVNLAQDTQGNVIVAISVSDQGIPTTPGAFQDTEKGFLDIFIMKINPLNFNLIFASYLGGSNQDEVRGITLDTSNNIYITGVTESSDFPISNSAFKIKNEVQDAFVTKMSSDGNKVLFSTYVGGSGTDQSYGISVDSQGDSYITGYTISKDFPVTENSIVSADRGGLDIFLTKVGPDGSKLLYSTLIGGSRDEIAYSIDIDSQDNIYITGQTDSSNFPSFYRLDQSDTFFKSFVFEFHDIPQDDAAYALSRTTSQPDLWGSIESMLILSFFSILILVTAIFSIIYFYQKRNLKNQN